MISWDARRVAGAAGAELLSAGSLVGGPRRTVIDSRESSPGDLFVALAGSRSDGGRFAEEALARGAWGVLTTRVHAERAMRGDTGGGALLIAADPLAALAALARKWRRELGATVVAVTGSTGKTSTKEMIAALLATAKQTVASPQNHNTEIGVPLSILAAPAGTQALVLELAMRAGGEIAALASICEPDVGVIVNVGPAHLELLGSLEAIAAAKAELITALPAGATAVLPAGEPLLEPHLRSDIEIVSFGEGGDVALREIAADGVTLELNGTRHVLEPGFRAAHLLTDLCAAVAAARAAGLSQLPARIDVRLAPLRGEHVELPGGVSVIDDCYNANPMSMRAALEELARTAPGRRVAVLGEMRELGAGSQQRYHRELGEHAERRRRQPARHSRSAGARRRGGIQRR